MTPNSYDGPGGEGCPLERFRARAIVYGFGTLAVLAFVTLFAVAVRARTIRADEVDGNRIVIIDGDTVALPGTPSERIRIYNIDAPETRNAHCEAENVAGLKAKERLAELLRDATVSVDRCEPSGRCEDRYRRTLARLSVKGRDVGGILVAEGRALPWATGAAARTARIAYWCGAQ